jgi:hypothetical protein
MTKSLLWDPVTKIWFLVMGSANPSKFCCCMVSQRGCFTSPKMSDSDDDVCMACKILLPTAAGRQYDSFATDPRTRLSSSEPFVRIALVVENTKRHRLGGKIFDFVSTNCICRHTERLARVCAHRET